MDFKELQQPSIFIASPGDLSELRGKVRDMFENLRNQVANHRNIAAYAWEVEVPKSGFEQWLPAQQQIPLPSSPNCRGVLCFFSERIGTPMKNTELYREHIGDAEKFNSERGRLVLDWQPGAEEDGGFPLTGTVFEVLAALAHNDASGRHERGDPPLHIWFIGDDTILTERADEANWGNKRYLNRVFHTFKGKRQSEFLDGHFRQLRQLRNFIEYLKGRNVPIGPESIVGDLEEVIQQCRAFLMKHLEYEPKRDIDPFKGLQFYDVKDDLVFFGRTQWLKDALEDFHNSWSDRQAPFYGVVGGSGVGKSSLLRAGLIARLESRGTARNCRCVVVTARDLIAPMAESVTGPDSWRAPLDELIAKVVECIGYGKVPSTCLDTDEAVQVLLSVLDHSARQDQVTPPDEAKLVIGLDQFEEIIDYRVLPAHSATLTSLFRFIPKACQTGRIGFLYTCQSNRLELLNSDPELTTLVEPGRRKWVLSADPDTISEIAQRKFEMIQVSLGRPVLENLQKRVMDFTNKAAQAAIQGEISTDSQASLLPLFSLTLQRLSRYCRQRSEELRRQKPRPRTGAKRFEGGEARADFGAAGESGGQLVERTHLTPEGTLVLALQDIPEELLRIESVITEQAERAVKEVRDAPGGNWSDDQIGNLLRRLVRIEDAQAERFYLPAVAVPERGSGKLLVQKLRENRLLIPVGRNNVRLVHQAIIRYWPAAESWLKREKDLLRASRQLYPMAEDWQADERAEKYLKEISPYQVDLAGRLLWAWVDVFRPKDGTTPRAEDRLLCEFALAVFAMENTPERVVEDVEVKASHFLTAVRYGQEALVRQYLLLKPSLAVSDLTSKGANAAYEAAASDDFETLDLVLQAGADSRLANQDGWQPLHVAANNGNIRLFDRLIEKGADANAPGGPGSTALHLAAENDDLAMVRHLIEVYKSHPNAKDQSNWTPLQAACRNGGSQAASFLLARDDIDTSLTDTEGWSAFLVACRYAEAGIVRELLKKPSTDPSANVNGWLPLHLCILRKSPGSIRALLEDRRIDRTSETPAQKTPVEFAAEEMGAEGVAALLADPFHEVKPDALAHDRESPLLRACRAGDVGLVRVLVEGGADVNLTTTSHQHSPFLDMAERGDLAVLRILLPKADPEITGNENRSALHLAAMNGHSAAVQEILRAIEPRWHSRRDRNGQTALHLAAGFGHKDTVEILLPYISPRLVDQAGETALHTAAAANQISSVRVLVGHDSELVAVPDLIGRLFAHIAVAYGHRAMLSRTIDPLYSTRRDAEGMLPLHYAARFGKAAILRDLLELDGADPDSVDDFGWTPLHMAAQAGSAASLQILLGHRASVLTLGKQPPVLPFHAAAAAGQTHVLHPLLPPDPNPDFWEEALLMAMNNAQFETALRILDLQGNGGA
jgi:cytohesin